MKDVYQRYLPQPVAAEDITNASNLIVVPLLFVHKYMVLASWRLCQHMFVCTVNCWYAAMIPVCFIGQFWKTEVSAERYHMKSEDRIRPDANHFAVTLKKASGEQRSFFAHLYGRTWDRKQKPCLYAGSSQGGRTMEVPSLNGTVIEGHYEHYIVDGLMEPKFEYSQFKSQCPTKA